MGERFYFTAEVAESLLKGEEIVSLDLNLSKTIVKREGDVFYLPNGQKIEKEDLEIIKRHKSKIFMFKDGKFYELAVRNEGYYKLIPTQSAPTIEIAGIRMHRTKEVDPWTDAKMKVSKIDVHGIVLDTCMGLGYTAIWARRQGSRYVVTVEVDENVLLLASLNPWSQEAFSDERIEIIKGDIWDLIRAFKNDAFDAIIHDPPRFSLGGELYSQDFYEELYRVLRPGGRIYHYVGAPGGKYRGKNLLNGVHKRLRKTGFKVWKDMTTMGIVGRKPFKKEK